MTAMTTSPVPGCSRYGPRSNLAHSPAPRSLVEPLLRASPLYSGAFRRLGKHFLPLARLRTPCHRSILNLETLPVAVQEGLDDVGDPLGSLSGDGLELHRGRPR